MVMSKIRFVCLIVLLFSVLGVKAQGEFSGLSNPVSLAMAKENVSIKDIPPVVYIKRYVEPRIAEWQKKGEFEKTIDYKKRINEQTRNVKVQQLTKEAIRQLKNDYSKSIQWATCELSQYDPDNETYLIKSEQLGDFAVPVIASEAPAFKHNWAKMQFANTDFNLTNSKLILSKLTIKNPASGKMYKYDSKQPSTYAVNNINYNFAPIEIDVKPNKEIIQNTTINNPPTPEIADVDINIPVNSPTNNKTFAVIIANENYKREVKVQYAANDGKIFTEYCRKTLGIPVTNIHFVQDATYGAMKSEIKWIADVIGAYNGQAKVIFYYAGHGMPDEGDKSAFLLPTDGFSSDFETAIKLDDLYDRLTASPSQSVTLFLDACFSGSVRDEGMLANARSVKIKPKTGALKGNMVVFSAATGDETAYPYKDKQHGLFTYFLLKKLQETKGDVDYDHLSNYIIENVKQQSVVVNQKLQTPQINTSADMVNTRTKMKFN